MKTAILVCPTAPRFRGDARLYKLSPPLAHEYRDEEPPAEYVVVSATDTFDQGPETYIFAADAEGRVTCWGEMPGSFRGARDHAAALAGAGYTIAHAEPPAAS